MPRRHLFASLVFAGAMLTGCTTQLADTVHENASGRTDPPVAAHAFEGTPKLVGHGAEDPTGYQVLTNIGYDIGYSNTRKTPLWAVYQVFPYGSPLATGRIKKWKTDNRTTARVTDNDYKHTGYDRGHMAPNQAIAARYGKPAQRETFVLSNACPQEPKMNNETWQYLETLISTGWGQDQDVGMFWVTVGPIFGPAPGHMGPAHIDVPEAFYCLVLAEIDDQFEVLALTMSQAVSGRQPLSDFVTTVHLVEEQTGLDFYWQLPDHIEHELQNQVPAEYWDIDQILK